MVSSAYPAFLMIFGITFTVLVWSAVELWRKPMVAERMSDSILQMRLGLGNERLARSLARAFLPGVLMMGFVCLTASSPLFAGGVQSIVSAVGLVGVAVSLVLMGLVALFNMPKFLVPPHMRADKGLFTRD
ncbi:hypothetical protein [Promicromonospora kroppenstedtii]|uniref:hypothetical protein n=1 Tax=Promicromonospora kroppenstedtii TaxID=440482 RepID=UPI001B7F8228|nr:hypothetical protein [Promicromonospora kroppenstedtii]